MLQIDVITPFPGILDGPLSHSIIKRAQEKELVRITTHDLRNYTRDKHRKIDDTPYGGGSGMVIKPEPVFNAVESLQREDTTLIIPSPQGELFTQRIAVELSKEAHLLFICGHYEGIDERVVIGLQPREISIGDYILTNGTVAAGIIIDVVVRLIPGVLGNPDSLKEDSFANGLLEYPQYTRPYEFRGMKVPDVLLSGNHEKIKKWRLEQAKKRTAEKRPDLLKKKV